MPHSRLDCASFEAHNHWGETIETTIMLLGGCARLHEGRNASERSLLIELFENLDGSIPGDAPFGQINFDHRVELLERKEDA